jgi:hypothetical protein
MTLVILLALVGATLAAPVAQRAQAQEEQIISTLEAMGVPHLLDKAENEGSVRVIVGVDAAFQPEGNLSSTQAVQTQR